MRIPNSGKKLLTLAALSIAALLLLACTAPQNPPAAIPDTLSEAQAEVEKMAANLSPAAITAAVSQPAAQTGISAAGRGAASAPPDLADLNLGVEAFAGSVKEARADAAAAMTAILNALQANGITDQDIRTDYFDIRPQYTGREITRCPNGDTEAAATAALSGIERGGELDAGCYQEWQQVLTGYQVSNTVNVKVRDLESLSPVIDAATAAGGDLTRFNGLSFSIEDTQELQQQARAAAVADLQERAAQLAEFGGVELRQLIYITETSFAPPARADLSKVAMAMESADASAGRSTPISAGQLSVEVTVQGIFAIR